MIDTTTKADVYALNSAVELGTCHSRTSRYDLISRKAELGQDATACSALVRALT